MSTLHPTVTSLILEFFIGCLDITAMAIGLVFDNMELVYVMLVAMLIAISRFVFLTTTLCCYCAHTRGFFILNLVLSLLLLINEFLSGLGALRFTDWCYSWSCDQWNTRIALSMIGTSFGFIAMFMEIPTIIYALRLAKLPQSALNERSHLLGGYQMEQPRSVAQTVLVPPQGLVIYPHSNGGLLILPSSGAQQPATHSAPVPQPQPQPQQLSYALPPNLAPSPSASAPMGYQALQRAPDTKN